MIVTKNEKMQMSEEQKKEYCEWCFYHDYGNCNNCALFKYDGILKQGGE